MALRGLCRDSGKQAFQASKRWTSTIPRLVLRRHFDGLPSAESLIHTILAFCRECLDARLSTRQRKCPSCQLAFGHADVHPVYFQG